MKPTVSNNQDNEKKVDSSNSKKKTSVFKFTFEDAVFESVIIAGKPFFLSYDSIKGELKMLDGFDQATRTLVPPNEEEYPYNPIKFQSKQEIDLFFRMFKEQHITIDSLFMKTRDCVSKFIVHHDHIIDYIVALILFSYFQDKFPTVPYTMFVSDNESGKSTIGDVIEVLGYRCVNMTDPTTANLFRIFGTIEAGQCMLVLDEAEKIDQDKDMMSILKTGYQYNKKVQRINPYGKQEHFHTYGLKIMLAERSPHPTKAKGVLDRTFMISNFRGKPELEIKAVKNPVNRIQKNIAKHLDFLRKSLLIYRFIHFNDEVKPINTGLEGRDNELCKHILQIFFGSSPQKRIERSLEILLDEKTKRKANSLERDVLEVVADLFKEYNDGIIPFSKIWMFLIDKTNGHLSPYKDHELETEAYGTIYKINISKMLRDRFGASDPKTRDSHTRCLVFDKEAVIKYLDDYREGGTHKINCRLESSDSSDSNDSNRKDPFASFFNDSVTSPESDDVNEKYGDIKVEKGGIVRRKENTNEELQQIQSSSNKFESNNDVSTDEDDSIGFITPKGLARPVIAVTKVTNTANLQTKTEFKNPINNLYRKWPGSDIWACKYCNDSGDTWYMRQHPCKLNKK